MIFILKLVMSFLLLVQEESNKHFNSIKFIYEQLNLMTQNKFDYLTKWYFLCYITAPPKGYILLRDSQNILPTYSTIKRLTLSTYTTPLIEQHDNNFLMYIKNKFKLCRKTPQYFYLLMRFTKNLILIIRVVILLVYLTIAIKLQKVLLLLCLAVYFLQYFRMLCQLNSLKLRIYFT